MSAATRSCVDCAGMRGWLPAALALLLAAAAGLAAAAAARGHCSGVRDRGEAERRHARGGAGAGSPVERLRWWAAARGAVARGWVMRRLTVTRHVDRGMLKGAPRPAEELLAGTGFCPCCCCCCC